ncbi:synaptotagmin-like protein 3 isoform X2 [Ornithorhynchus anatinus]|uniref:synaptotagmin-like protein 3 isoform X2 n=1 Tax=Ornithorhynchus anatinus TaxID=9258 RepID=UPI0010A75680|nr:synaptotagmin-like protein 3 isoform X2 [Ornithorhynchus anatinus]
MTEEVNLHFLKELEREMVLEVLYRDQLVQKVEEERIRKLKLQLQQLRWRGAKSASQDYSQNSCARCHEVLGLLMNRGAVCQGCSHRVCSQCRLFLENTRVWKCTVCFADGDVKAKTGEWFLEERAKKFPTEGKHETTGAKLLKSYQKLSKISVVPPTPPPFRETQHGAYNQGELGQTRGFNKSMENLFLSLTTQMKKISKSQNDMTTGRGLLTTNYERSLGRQNERRSQSDTAINLTKQIESSPNLLQLINQENLKTSTNITWRGKEDGSSSPTHSTVFLGGRKHGSLLSLNSTCTEAGNFEKADVTGEIEFAIRYIFKTRTLEVCIKACKNLAYGEEKKKKCNPYVKAYLLPDKSSQGKRKTSVKKNTVDPAFHETLKYLVDHAQLVTRLLQISVWHRGTLTRRVFLGEVLVPLTSWNFEDHTTQAFRWYQLKAKAEGCNDDPDHYPGELTPWAKPITPAMGSKSRSEKLGPGGSDHLPLPMDNCLVTLGARNVPTRSDGSLNSLVKGGGTS